MTKKPPSMKHLTLLLLFALPLLVQAQGTANVDSAYLAKFETELYDIFQANPREAIRKATEAEAQYRPYKYTNTHVQSSLYYTIANFYFLQGLYDEALLLITDIQNNSAIEEVFWIEQKATIYQALHKFDQAEQYYKEAIEKADKPSRKRNYYASLSDCYIQANRPQDAIIALSTYRTLIEENDSSSLSLYYHNSGVSYRELGEYDFAELNLKKALTMDRLLHAGNYDMLYDYYEIGNLWKSKGNPALAMQYYDSALAHVDPSLEKSLILELYRTIYNTCELLNDYKKGFHASLRYTSLRDSIYSEERLQNLGTIELKSFLLQKQNEEQEQLARTRLIQYSAVFVALLIVITILFYLKRFDLNPKILGSTVFITLLLLFEFILVVMEPLLAPITGNTPVFILLANFVIALLFVPVHRGLETWFEKKVVAARKPMLV